MANWFEKAINGFVAGMDWFVNTVFYFVNPTILKMFAFSLLIMVLIKIRVQWFQFAIVIIYTLYTILKIVQIREWIISMAWNQFILIIPYVCMLILPILLKNTKFGQYAFNQFALFVWYLLLHIIWSEVVPFDVNLLHTGAYCVIVFVILLITIYINEQTGAKGAQLG